MHSHITVILGPDRYPNLLGECLDKSSPGRVIRPMKTIRRAMLKRVCSDPLLLEHLNQDFVTTVTISLYSRQLGIEDAALRPRTYMFAIYRPIASKAYNRSLRVYD